MPCVHLVAITRLLDLHLLVLLNSIDVLVSVQSVEGVDVVVGELDPTDRSLVTCKRSSASKKGQ